MTIAEGSSRVVKVVRFFGWLTAGWCVAMHFMAPDKIPLVPMLVVGALAIAIAYGIAWILDGFIGK